MFKALLLDADSVLEAVVELASEDELTERHVDLRPLGGDCDCKPGAYRWDAEARALMPLKPYQVKAAAGGYSLEQAFCALLEANPQLKVPDVVMVWRAGYRASIDAADKKKKQKGK
jgi:hypothetical protein